jgi:hypothetical protein
MIEIKKNKSDRNEELEKMQKVFLLLFIYS